MSEFTVRAKNFRVLEHLEWSPSGVCLLGGANGAGKTTTLDALKFLALLFSLGQESAFSASGGDYFGRLGAPPDEPVTFEVEVEGIVWKLRFPMDSGGMKGGFGEELLRNGAPVLTAAMYEQEWSLGKKRFVREEGRSCARALWDRGDDRWMEPLVALLNGLRVYEAYWLNQVRRSESPDLSASFLHGTGRNLWSVLANWKGAPMRYRGQFAWVMKHAALAFPDLVGSLEFDRGLPYLFRPGATDPSDGLPPRRAPDGLLTGLLHLTAVAGARDGAVIAFDELENQLHPHAIRAILTAMREAADERGLTIILTTHSPVVMNEFKGFEDQFFVLDDVGDAPQPRLLTEVRSEAWLSHFALGDLYEREAIAPQTSKRPAGS